MSPFISATDEQTLRNVAMICYELDEDFSETDVTKESLDFIQSLLVEDPSGRLTAKECLQHIWIKGPAEQRRHSIISTEQLRIFNAKRKWHSTVKAVQACLSLKGKGQLPYQNLEFQTAEMEASGSSEFSEKDTVWSVSSGNEPTTWHKSDSIPSTSKTRKLRETSTWYSQTAGIWSQVSNDSGIDLSSPQILERHLLVDHNPVGTASALLDQTPRSPLETHCNKPSHEIT
jgi:serine/threonine protein kinase